MDSIQWDMSCSTIVRKLSEEAEQSTFAPPHLDKVKQGELHWILGVSSPKRFSEKAIK